MVETLQVQQIMAVQLIREYLLFLSFGVQYIMHIKDIIMNVSIVIPTYNRLPILEKCLFALENQKLNTNIIFKFSFVIY